jgi:hypothetical protein
MSARLSSFMITCGGRRAMLLPTDIARWQHPRAGGRTHRHAVDWLLPQVLELLHQLGQGLG